MDNTLYKYIKTNIPDFLLWLNRFYRNMTINNFNKYWYKKINEIIEYKINVYWLDNNADWDYYKTETISNWFDEYRIMSWNSNYKSDCFFIIFEQWNKESYLDACKLAEYLWYNYHWNANYNDCNVLDLNEHWYYTERDDKSLYSIKINEFYDESIELWYIINDWIAWKNEIFLADMTGKIDEHFIDVYFWAYL